MATQTASPTPQLDQQKMMDFAFKVVGDLAAAMSGPLVYIGDHLGLFKVLAASGSLTVQQLADKTSLNTPWCWRMKIARCLSAAWRR